MDLKEAIKTCIANEVDISCFSTMVKHNVWLPRAIFLKWFKEYKTEAVNEGLNRLTVIEGNIEYKCYDWTVEKWL